MSVATPEQLRELLLTPEQAAALDSPGGSTDAAVLVPLYLQGEVSFPGGRQDFPEEDLRQTALREAEEEIGLPPDDVELVGALPPTGTFVTGYRIHPFVGLIGHGHTWTPQEAEVERVLEMSLPELVDGFDMKRLIRRGVPIKTPTYTVDGNLVWGATARIVQQLLKRLEPLLP